MLTRSRLSAVGVSLALSAALAGCGPFQLTDMLNPELLSALGMGKQVASLPGDAPGLLVSVENRTDRWVSMVVAYRDEEENVESFTTVVAPGDKSGQMLVCPVTEITLGDVSSPNESGAWVYLVDNVDDTASLDAAPYIEVDPFGVLLREGVNYDCGDGLLFTVQPSSQSRSGYRAYAYVRRSGAP